ncbi:DUF134 domain-containing protein [Ectothiorhodospira haloalkaliphila]|uniref:DUF134 domain-containing protein n=1 Tax=Ectothiorhodospira haloalkaliphila TaxID=421628 RepID=UPI001EE8820A|nr:DUF134 domain-containing protein [Ectothiorhodospira haloalkaliphila]MCG5524194.1 DUF134 domain-containing protein [Ectothiorhodospira haloalkaliphila]
MPRPRGPRKISCSPGSTYFKPAGVPLRELEESVLEMEEVEALRLADLEGQYQEEAARSMGVSRSTFSRILDSGRRKVADAVLGGKAIRISKGVPEEGQTEVPCRVLGVCPMCDRPVDTEKTG